MGMLHIADRAFAHVVQFGSRPQIALPMFVRFCFHRSQGRFERLAHMRIMSGVASPASACGCVGTADVINYVYVLSLFIIRLLDTLKVKNANVPGPANTRQNMEAAPQDFKAELNNFAVISTIGMTRS